MSLKSNINFRLYKTYLRVSKVLGSRKAKLWILVENPGLGYVTPLQMILLDRYVKLTQFIVDAISTNKK